MISLITKGMKKFQNLIYPLRNENATFFQNGRLSAFFLNSNFLLDEALENKKIFFDSEPLAKFI